MNPSLKSQPLYLSCKFYHDFTSFESWPIEALIPWFNLCGNSKSTCAVWALCTRCHSLLAESPLRWIHLDCGTLSCSAITNVPCLSIKCRPQGAFAASNQVTADHKSFPVSERSCTRGSVASVPVRLSNQVRLNQSVSEKSHGGVTVIDHQCAECCPNSDAAECRGTSAVVFVKQIFKFIWRLNWGSGSGGGRQRQRYWVAALNLSGSRDSVDFPWAKRD